MGEKIPPNEIQTLRTYDAPLPKVWDAFTDLAQVSQWWGPRGFTITTHSKDFKVGGVWHYTMHGPNGANYINKAKYLEIQPLKKLVYDQGGNDLSKLLFRVTVVFSEKAGRTTMDMRMAFATAEAAENSRQFIKKAGGETTWDRLAEHLAARSTPKQREN